MTTKLQAIRAREQAAWPGPWEVKLETFPPYEFDSTAYVIWSQTDKHRKSTVADSGNPQMAEFIAHARTDIPLLLAVAEAAAAVYPRLGPVQIGDGPIICPYCDRAWEPVGHPGFADFPHRENCPAVIFHAALAALMQEVTE